MAEAKPTPHRLSFQLRGPADGVAAAYLLWRLTERIEATKSGCWEWQGARQSQGYGTIHLKNWNWPERVVVVHRLIYELCVDAIPDGLCVLHRCDNPRCVRPDHLFAGSNGDNIADKVAKGRQARGQSVRRNHGHLKGETVKTARLTAEDVLAIRKADADGESPAVIAERHGISGTQVRTIVSGRSWAHLPFVAREDNSRRACPKCGLVVVTRQGAFYRHVAECGRD